MKKKEFLFSFSLSVVVVIFFFRLLELQVIDDSYKLKADENSKVKINIYPDRGFIYDRNKNLLVGNKYIYDIIVIPSELRGIDTNLFLKSVDLPQDYILDNIDKIFKSKEKKVVFLEGITSSEYGMLKEFIYRERGFYVEKKMVRDYIIKGSSNLLGYIGEITSSDLSGDNYYNMGDVIGYSGIEKSYEKYLRGSRGSSYFYTDVKRNERESYKDGKYDVLPQKGSDIILSIDKEIQEYGEKLMKNKRGSIVAIDPNTGQILSLVSSPNYSPELLVGRDRNKNYNILNKTEGLPLYDRSLLAQYPPGSIFKVMTGLIALQEKKITKYTLSTCNYGYRLSRNKIIGCKCGTGNVPINIGTAIEKSCNTFFIKTYRNIIDGYNNNTKVGYLKWYDYVHRFSLNTYYNNDLHTGKKGFIPSVDFYDKIYGKDRWYSTFIVSNAIGQGEVLMTPVQMANFAAIVANRGYYYTPHIIKNIEGHDINKKYKEKIYTFVDEEHFETVISGMRRAIEKGTSRIGDVEGIEICGKTGTSQNPHGKDHSIFMAFAPKDNPKIAISIIIENGGYGATWAVPIGSLIIEKYINGEVKRNYLEDYVLKGDLTNNYK